MARRQERVVSRRAHREGLIGRERLAGRPVLADKLRHDVELVRAERTGHAKLSDL